MIEEVIKKQDGKYFVFSEGGKKLGGPYDTRAQAVKRLEQVETFKNKESLVWETQDFKITEAVGEDKGKWLRIEGTALEVGVSKNKRAYSYKNLQENDGKNFNWIVGHKEDYDNPDHNVGEGLLSIEGNKLKYDGKIKNTAHHPDIIEQARDNLVAPSIHGGGKITKSTNESGELEYNIEGLQIPLIALVNKHARGVPAANIEAAIMERFEREDEDDELETKESEDIKMEQEQIIKENEDLKKQLKEAQNKLDNQAKEHIVESILKINKELNKNELMEKSVDVLKIIEQYETKIAEQDEEGKEEDEKEDDKEEGAGEVEGDSTETAPEKNEIDGIVVEKGDICMSKERYAQFNKDIRESIYR